MPWKTYFSLNGGKCEIDSKKAFAFRSRYHPPQSFELENFEKDLFNILNSSKFSNYKKQSENVFYFVDKTSNIYEMSTEQYKIISEEAVTKTYKEALPKLQRSISLEVKHIAVKIKLSSSIEKLVETPSNVTLKDYKENFRSNPSCRIINP